MEEILDASELVRWMEVPQHPNVFALGPFARQVTFAAQQTRAFNLIWALFRLNRLARGQKLAIVGAGLAGMTAAVAALSKGCEVHLFEQASQTCPVQRGNDIRFIHPNILRWPDEGSETAHTDFPFLNWTAANVRGVIKQIDLQWKRHVVSDKLRKFFNYKVTRLFVSPSKSGPQRPWLAANRVIDGNAAGDEIDGFSPGYVEFSYDCVILAVGFGEEKSMLAVPFLSYWENDSLHQETGRGHRSILISGCGDGGLIDALRLRLRNFDHADFVRRFLGAVSSQTLVTELRQVERDLRRHARVPDISLRLQAAYDAIPVPEEIQQYFRVERRADASVTLNSPAPGPLSFGSSLLNRYATYLAMRYADLHYLSGRVVAERAGIGEYQVTFRRDDVDLCETRAFDLLIVRHGPEGVIRKLVPDAAIRELAMWWAENEDITTKPYWIMEKPYSPHQFFKEFATETVPPAKDILDLAMATFEPAYREFTADPSIESLAVGERAGKAGFIVTLKPGVEERQSTFFAGVLVQFVRSEPVAATTEVPVQAPVYSVDRPISIGAGIYNYDAALRHAERGKRLDSSKRADAELGREATNPFGTGTLGCFAADDAGTRYLISTAFVLSPENLGQPGDRIFIEGESPTTGHLAIATLTRVESLPATESTSNNTFVDAASAQLMPNIRPNYEPLQPNNVRGAGVGRAGDHVIKMGRTSGLTTGVIETTASTVSIMTGASKSTLFEDCILIKGDKGRDFSLPGDGGAVVVRDDGRVIGLLIAASRSTDGGTGINVACSFERVLKQLNVTLLTSQKLEGATPALAARMPRTKRSARGRRKIRGVN